MTVFDVILSLATSTASRNVEAPADNREDVAVFAFEEFART